MNSIATAEWSLRMSLGDTQQILTYLKKVSDTEITYNMCGDFEMPKNLHVTKEGFFLKYIGYFQSVLIEEPKKFSTLHVAVVDAPWFQCFPVHLVANPKVSIDIVYLNKLR